MLIIGLLLVDDDDATNFIHKYVIEEAEFAENIKVVENGKEALDYLISTNESGYLRPNLIFLDINMPVMDGWEFLKHYKQLGKDQQGHMMVVMITTSLNPDDKDYAESTGAIDHFMSKPLTVEMLQELQLHINTEGY